MKWEYKTVEIITSQKSIFQNTLKQLKASAIDEKLNPLGQGGWELVTVFNASPVMQVEVTMAVFKRPLQ